MVTKLVSVLGLLWTYLVGRTGRHENQEAMSPRTTGDSLRPARPGSSKGLAGGGCFEFSMRGCWWGVI